MDLTRLRRRAEAVPPWAGEAILCTAALAVTVYRIGTAAPDGGERSPDAWAYGIGLAMAVVLPVRRRSPALALGAVFLLWVIYHIANYPGGAPAIPVWIALFSVAAAPRRRTGLALAGWLIVSDALARTKSTGASLFDAALDGSTVVFVAALLLGDSVRSRRARRAEYEARLALLAAHRDQAAAQRLTEERMRIARELHDVSAHTIAVINVQASVAAELLTEAPDQAREALEAVRRAGGEALAEMRATVGVLREPDRAEGDLAPPAPGIDRLPDLALAGAGSGPRVDVRVEGERRPLPRLVEFTAYRIAQESLTNALRHSGAGLVEILVRYKEAGLVLEVRDDGGGGDDRPRKGPGWAGEGDRRTGWRGRVTEDDGRTGAPGRATGGNGLRGMAERVAGLGGRFSAGPFEWPGGAGRGFRVRAWLPATNDDPATRTRVSRAGDRTRGEETT
ncbi:sensor histidine kinase [Actinoallomurus spadix]|uniref:histidine kinase n=1 Tax=Actinoallomurus spadix TaxID=79912 RepID=A0ABN0X5W9_9ACTN|nr:sensor histidine kinase [Actinoallomurus spadix]MCO5986892.1 sensor histidine kinase [Actinoallomurus spadix]